MKEFFTHLPDSWPLGRVYYKSKAWWEKKDSTSSPNKFQGKEPVYMLQIFDTETLGKLFWRCKKTQLGRKGGGGGAGGWGGQRKV